ncbi:unnamed protein product [Medioppia subpectinata]|uniref:Small EDRK-rich factor-like N-terminal domain-containing protein n=1 Tax=Medioppia subpectinata TaxID=1979941 RepID=A0A7R9KBW4_9ACAR|nr:unnamed protein product [Medioppia subpectinata]CAG2100462.1 unnamed protein product [Medioppia subpectinata]
MASVDTSVHSLHSLVCYHFWQSFTDCCLQFNYCINWSIGSPQTMTRGNQRELAREKNQKKLKDQQKKKGADNKDGNRGMTLEERKHRDAELMREKQKLAAEKKGGSSGETSGSTAK